MSQVPVLVLLQQVMQVYQKNIRECDLSKH